jgi:hypothetical protein
MSLVVAPAEKPSICVCTAPDTPTVHKSELELLMVGDIAEGGGDLTVVSEFKLELTVEFVLLFVSIQLELVVLSQPSAITSLAISHITSMNTAHPTYTNVFLTDYSPLNVIQTAPAIKVSVATVSILTVVFQIDLRVSLHASSKDLISCMSLAAFLSVKPMLSKARLADLSSIASSSSGLNFSSDI